MGPIKVCECKGTISEPYQQIQNVLQIVPKVSSVLGLHSATHTDCNLLAKCYQAIFVFVFVFFFFCSSKSTQLKSDLFASVGTEKWKKKKKKKKKKKALKPDLSLPFNVT